MKRAAVLIFVLLVFGLFSVKAQSNVISYGDVVNGEITDDNYEIEYTFQGKQSDVIIARLEPIETFGDLDNPELILLRPNGRVLIDTTKAFNYGRAFLVGELPEDGEYTLIASRRDGRAGDSKGEFSLELLLPQLITEERSVSNEVSSDAGDQYYVVRMSSPFGVVYQKTGGQFFPKVAVSILDAPKGGLQEIGVHSGDELTIGALGMFKSEIIYVVSVGEAPFDFNFRAVTAEYALSFLSQPVNIPS